MGLGALALLSSRPKPRYTSPYTPGAPAPAVPELRPDPIDPTPSPAPTEPGVKTAPTVTYYRVIDSPNGPVLHPEVKTLEAGAEKLDDEARIKVAITEMAKGETPLLPKGTRLLRLKLEGTTALFDLSKELKDNFPGGDKAEQLVVNALTATAGQLPKVEKVQIFVEGAAIESLGGTQSLLEPLKVPDKG